jgi:hypothetical protein
MIVGTLPRHAALLCEFDGDGYYNRTIVKYSLPWTPNMDLAPFEVLMAKV